MHWLRTIKSGTHADYITQQTFLDMEVLTNVLMVAIATLYKLVVMNMTYVSQYFQ